MFGGSIPRNEVENEVANERPLKNKNLLRSETSKSNSKYLPLNVTNRKRLRVECNANDPKGSTTETYTQASIFDDARNGLSNVSQKPLYDDQKKCNSHVELTDAKGKSHAKHTDSQKEDMKSKRAMSPMESESDTKMGGVIRSLINTS